MSLAVELVAWWCLAVGVWMLSLSAYSSQDLIVAVACGVPCAAAAAAARRAVRGAWRAPAAALRWAVVLPWSVALDTARVLTLPWTARRSTAGELHEVELAAGDSAAAAGRRALAAVLMSATPGAYVVDIDATSGTAVVHRIVATSPIERVISR